MKRFLAVLALVSIAATAAAADPTSPSASLVLEGTVLEVQVAGVYTYLKIQTTEGEAWVAVPSAVVSAGARVSIEDAALMANFESKSLQRTFDRIVFGVLGSQTAEAPTAAPLTSPHTTRGAGGSVKISKVDGPAGYSVAEIITQRADLGGQTVVVRGQVVKYNAAVMGKNWVHLRDGSGSAADNSHDLLVTTTDSAKLGDIMTVQGTVAVNQDFGGGYTYPVLLGAARLQSGSN